ncbi:MAG: hypothetical protein DMG65_01360 [Candidatus Angelobacter sp. Gp1-AA117]|nr:MAG: hypothetical protein DMG65_01360 [Candidatus Angelobacter sp. Gp1-AA117]
MDAIDYKILLENIFQKAGQLLQVRDSTEVEIAKLNQLFCATLNMVPHDQRLFFKSRMVEIGAMKDCGLNEGIRNVLLAADGWMTCTMVRDMLVKIGFDFSSYDSNPLPSICTALRRWKPEEVEAGKVNGVNAYRWKRRIASVKRGAESADVLELVTAKLSS